MTVGPALPDIDEQVCVIGISEIFVVLVPVPLVPVLVPLVVEGPDVPDVVMVFPSFELLVVPDVVDVLPPCEPLFDPLVVSVVFDVPLEGPLGPPVVDDDGPFG